MELRNVDKFILIIIILFVRSGFIGTMRNGQNYGYAGQIELLYGSTAFNANASYAYYLLIDKTRVTTDFFNYIDSNDNIYNVMRSYGYSLRCLAS